MIGYIVWLFVVLLLLLDLLLAVCGLLLGSLDVCCFVLGYFCVFGGLLFTIELGFVYCC